jgi:hypothetical protein
MIRTTVLACLLVAALAAMASDGAPSPVERGPYVDLAGWMIEQDDPQMRAVGLAALSGSRVPDGESIAPDRFVDEARALLRDAPSGAVAYMLANACSAAGLVDRCASIGVPEAVERFDGGNPLAAGVFLDADSSGYRNMLIEAEYVDDHYPEYVSAWYEVLRARRLEDLPEGSELVTATGFAMAVAVPSMQELMDTCRAAVGSDEQLDAACQRLSEQMRQSGRTVFLRSMGAGLARQRAEALGDDALAEQLREWAAALHPAACLTDAANEALASDVDVQRDFLADLRTDGEVAAFEALLEDHGSRCEDGAGGL